MEISKKKDRVSILKVIVHVNGIKMGMTLDSESTDSIISFNQVKWYRLNINKTNIKVKVADNSVSLVIGITDVLSIEIGGRITYLPLLIMEAWWPWSFVGFRLVWAILVQDYILQKKF